MLTHYDETEHKYYVNGIEVPSITEICSPISAQRLNALEQFVLARARERGRRCHELAEEFMLTSELNAEEIETDYIPYMQQFILWAKTYKPKPLYTEFQMFSEEYCGTADLICEIDGKTIIVDYKFTSQADKKSLSVQLEGYYRLSQKLGIAIDDTYYLHIKKDGFVFKPIVRNAEWFDILLRHNKFMRGKYG